MSVLKFRNPETNEWLHIPTIKGDQGEIGPAGKTGPAGPAGKDGVNGRDGVNGKDGRDGKDGRTPVVGVDYFTEADKKEIADQIRDDLTVLDGDEINYRGKIPDINNVQDAVDFIYDYAIGTDVVEDMIAQAFSNIKVAEDGAY